MSLGMELGLGQGDFMLDGDHAPPPQTAGWMKLVLGMEVGLSPGDFVLDGDPVPFPKKGQSPLPKFSAHLYCGETAACIKMSLGMKLGLGPGALC